LIGHQSCNTTDAAGEVTLQTYVNIAFVFDRKRHQAIEKRIIGTRSCYPPGPAKKPHLADVAFTSGIVMRPDGRVDLYSGIGDAEIGRAVIDCPFAGHGKIQAG